MGSTTVHTLAYHMTADTNDFTKGLVLSKSELRKVDRTLRDIKTPLDKYQEEIDFLNRALRSGSLTQDQFNRAVGRLKKPTRAGADVLGALTSRFGSLATMLTPAGAVLAAIGATTAAFHAMGRAAEFSLDKINESMNRLEKRAQVLDKLNADAMGFDTIAKAAEKAGVGEDKLSTAMQRMTRRISEAAHGSKGLQETLAELGLSGDILKNMTADQQFYAIADAMGKIDNATDRLRLTVALFDSEGADLVTMLTAGSKEIKRQGDLLSRIGLGYTRDDLRLIEESNASWTELTQTLQAMWDFLSIQMAPVWKAVADGVNEAAQSGHDWGESILNAADLLMPIMADVVNVAHLFGAELEQAAIRIDYIDKMLRNQAQLFKTGNVNRFLEQSRKALQEFDFERARAGERWRQALTGEFSRKVLSSYQSLRQQQSQTLDTTANRESESIQKDQAESLRALVEYAKQRPTDGIKVRTLF